MYKKSSAIISSLLVLKSCGSSRKPTKTIISIRLTNRSRISRENHATCRFLRQQCLRPLHHPVAQKERKIDLESNRCEHTERKRGGAEKKRERGRRIELSLVQSSSVNRKSSFLENLLAMSMRSSSRWCINNTQEPVEARAARIKSHNALVQTNARWQCYGVREFTTLKSGEYSEGRWEQRQRWRRNREREREKEAGVAQEERSSRVGTPLERALLV